MALDYASIMAGGQQLVPDLRIQSMQDQAFDWQRQDRARAEEERVNAQRMDAAYQQSLQEAMTSGDPQAVIRLMARFPQMRDAIKPLYEAMDQDQRRADVTQIGSIYANATAGNTERAAAILEQRVMADRQVGRSDPNDEAILAGLRSADQTERNSAIATIGIMLAAATGDEFTNTYGKLNPVEAKTSLQREYEWRVATFGQDKADQWLAVQDTELVSVEPGGSVFSKSDFATPVGPVQQGGGDPASSDPRAGVPAPILDQNGRPESLTPAQYQAVVAARGKAATDAWLAQYGIPVRQAPAQSGPVRVASRQQYEALPPGTEYIAPDGSVRRKN